MISSGALPKVALSRPPMASPVRIASCSVDKTIRCATGTIDNAAQKNSSGALACAYSSAIETGMKASSQLMEGAKRLLIDGCSAMWLIETIHHREKEPGGPAAHQDAGEGLDGALHPPSGRQHDIAVPSGRIGYRAEVESDTVIGQRSVR